MTKKEKEEKIGKKKITFKIDKEKNFSKWFSEIVAKAELADLRYNVKGFVVFAPWSVLVMEKMYDAFEQELQKQMHLPCYFPSLIPEENFKKEAKHVSGFKPEVFWVTQAGNKKIEKLALRPTSETAFFQLYSLWIRSYKDLPFKRYQRANIFRYETKTTHPFMRSREFYWLEAHDCFASKEDAEKQVQEDIAITEKIMHQKFGIPSIPFRRPEWDKFAGAIYTIGSDVLMPDGKLTQQPSTHLLDQGFAKVFNIRFKDEKGEKQFVWQTCYGPCISRIFASLIALHGDNSGLIYPFFLAPIQVIIIPIFTAKNKPTVLKKVKEVEKKLTKDDISSMIDDREIAVGEKFYYWEMKGVPLRLEIGEKELKGKLTLFLRDEKKRKRVSLAQIKKEGLALDRRLRKKADSAFEKAIVNVKNFDELKTALKNKKIARCNFCSIDKKGERCAAVVEKELLASVRGVRADKKEKAKGKCIFCSKKAGCVVYIAKSY